MFAKTLTAGCDRKISTKNPVDTELHAWPLIVNARSADCPNAAFGNVLNECKKCHV
jgi:hypothetical protein